MTAEFTILPFLGRKTDVPIDDYSLFKSVGDNIVMTHDVGGQNFDVTRKRMCCSKSMGTVQWDNTAISSATGCLGLHELYDGTNRNHLIFDHGNVYIYDSSLDPIQYTDVKFSYDSGGTTEPTIGETVSENGGDASGTLVSYTTDSGTWAGGDAAGTFYIQTSTGTWTNNAQLDGSTTGADMATLDGTASSTTFASDAGDLYSIIKVGDYAVWADRAENMPYKWKHGESHISPLIISGTQYKFRYLLPFQRRVIGAYSDQTDGDIDLRYSTPWPTTAITALNFPAANQLYVPNDDPITGLAKIGNNRAFVLCEDSIHDLVYYQNFDTPFGLIPLIEGHGCASHHSIVNAGGRLYFFNKNYGFCAYSGGSQFPDGGRPISSDIDEDIQSFLPDYYGVIYGKFLPSRRQIVWSVPYASSTSSRLYFYNIDSGQWTFDDKSARCIDHWILSTSYTWNDFADELGGATALWEATGTKTWAQYTSAQGKPVVSNTDGHLYQYTGENLAGSAIDGYRVEPALNFGDGKTQHFVREIWFGIVSNGNYNLKAWLRGGDSIADLTDTAWTSQPNLSLNSPTNAVIYANLGRAYRYHQIKWGTDGADEKFEINRITFRYENEGGY